MQGFDYKELLLKFRYPILGVLVGLILVAGGILFFKSGINISETKVEVLNSSDSTSKSITAEISGEVISPGVYKLPNGSRINDLLIAAGGLSNKADRSWTDKYLNRAAPISDGQKVYVLGINQQSSDLVAKQEGGDQTASSTFSSDSNQMININTASLEKLDTLPGIGQKYGQSIIEHRPYSNLEELVFKGVIKQNLFEKIKNNISIY